MHPRPLTECAGENGRENETYEFILKWLSPYCGDWPGLAPTAISRVPKTQWRAEVGKMRTAYKAPIDSNDVDSIVDYLAGLGSPR